MESKIILITGATQGIGKETATTLAKQGHHVIIHGRNQEKLNTVAQEIKSVSGSNKVETIVADLFSFADIKRMTDEFKTRFDHLDVLINNAGAIMNKDRQITNEGLEKTMTLNVFAPFLLMNSLLEVLKKSPSARIVNLSSAMHRRSGKPDFNDFQVEKNYAVDKVYGLSKLYLIWITQHMAKFLKEKGINNITVNATHPGAVKTNFGQDSKKGFLFDMIFKLAMPFVDKVEDGAKSSIYLATSPEVQNITGQFYSNKAKPEKPADKYYSAENEQIVWDYCVKTTKNYV